MKIQKRSEDRLSFHLVDSNTLEKFPDVLIQLEKDWNLINSLDSDAYIQWLEKSDPIQVENYRLYCEYRNTKNKPKPRHVLFARTVIRFFKIGLGYEIAQSVLLFLWNVLVAAGASLLIILVFGSLLAAIVGLIYVGTLIFLKSQVAAGVYLIFMMLFIPIFLGRFIDY